MQTADLAVLCFYLLGMLAVGFYYARRNSGLKEMFAAGGRSPWWVAGLSGFMTMFSAGTFVVWGGIAYRHGLVAIMINLSYGVAALIVAKYLAAKWKSLAIETPSQFVELRFGLSVVTLYTVLMMVFRIIGAGAALYALCVLLAAMVPLPEGHLLRDAATGNLSVPLLALIFGTLIVIYTMAGGLWAVLMTDVLQFIILNLAVIFILPLILMAGGGPQTILENLPENFFAPTGGGYGILFILGWAAIHVFMIGGDWAFVQRHLSVPKPRDAQRATLLFGVLYLVSPWLWLAPPLIYRSIDAGADPEQAYILAAQAVLPAGLVGLVLAAMFSATASLVSSQLNVFAGVMTERVIRSSDSLQARATTIGRGFTLLLGAAVTMVAISVPLLGGAERLVISSTSLLIGPLLAPSVLALLSDRIGAASVWASVGSAAILGLIIKTGAAPFGISEWAAANSALADLVVGLGVPTIVLGIAWSMAAGRVDAGAERLRNAARQAAPEEVGEPDRTPAYVVMIALLASAGLIGVLGVLTPGDRAVMLIFSLILLAISASIYMFGLREKSSGVAATN